MSKWRWVSVISFGLISLSGYALADSSAVLPTNDSMGCTALIQQGDLDPVAPTYDMQTLKTCMSSCNALYSKLVDNGQTLEAMQGATYCRKSLNNLYYASTAQTISDQLDLQIPQDESSQDQLLQKIQQLQQQQQKKQQTTAPASSNSTPTNTNQPTTPTHTTPVGPAGNINW